MNYIELYTYKESPFEYNAKHNLSLLDKIGLRKYLYDQKGSYAYKYLKKNRAVLFKNTFERVVETKLKSKEDERNVQDKKDEGEVIDNSEVNSLTLPKINNINKGIKSIENNTENKLRLDKGNKSNNKDNKDKNDVTDVKDMNNKTMKVNKSCILNDCVLREKFCSDKYRVCGESIDALKKRLDEVMEKIRLKKMLRKKFIVREGSNFDAGKINEKLKQNLNNQTNKSFLDMRKLPDLRKVYENQRIIRHIKRSTSSKEMGERYNPCTFIVENPNIRGTNYVGAKFQY